MLLSDFFNSREGIMNVDKILAAEPIHTVTQEAVFSAKRGLLNERYESSLVSMGRGPRGLGDAIVKMMRAFALVMFFPVFIYAAFLVSISVIFLPFFLFLIPFLIAHRVMRELFHCMFPWTFSDPNHRYY